MRDVSLTELILPSPPFLVQLPPVAALYMLLVEEHEQQGSHQVTRDGDYWE